MDRYLQTHLRHNFIVNVCDGGFYGLALGFASFVTVLPLFVSHFTDSAILIGLIPAIHTAGWQLPQLLLADRVARADRYKPMVIWLTLLERFPFLGFGLIALGWTILPREVALVLTYLLLIVQGLGAGLAATPWQNMLAKIIPPERRGTFFGTQAAAANLLASVSAIVAGIILEQFSLPINFALVFALASVALIFSFAFLAWTRESSAPPPPTVLARRDFRGGLVAILRRDINFRWFLVVRVLFHLATMAFAFYTVYVVRYHHVSVLVAGALTSVYMGSQIVANPVMGWVGDHWGHRVVLQVGALAAVASTVLAVWSPSAEWFYLVFILAGVSNVAAWTIMMTMTIDFAKDPAERPAYVGLANTLVAPFAIIAPLLGGWLADTTGYASAFSASAIGGVLAWLVLRALIRDPRARQTEIITS